MSTIREVARGANQSLQSYLEACSIKAIGKGMVQVSGEEPILDAFSRLVSNQVTSAPVYSEEMKQYTGLVDLLDFAILAIKENDELVDVRESVAFKQPVEVLAESDRSNPFVTTGDRVSMWTVITRLAERRCHRLCLEDEYGKLVGLVPESAVLRWLTGVDLGEKFRQPLTSFKTSFLKKITVVYDSMTAKDAFALLYHEDLVAVPIVDNRGRMLSLLQLSDLKVLLTEGGQVDLSLLLLDVMDFVGRSRAAAVAHQRAITVGLDSASPEATAASALTSILVSESVSEVTLGPNDSLVDALTVVAGAKAHRVFVIDENRRPVGVVSPADVFRLILDESSA